MEVLRLVAVVDVAQRTDAASGEPHPPPVLIEPPSRQSVHDADSRAIDLVEFDGRFAGANSTFQERVKLIQVRRGEVDAFWQVQIIQLLQMMPQHRIDLGLALGRLENPRVANSLLLREADGDEDQRRIESLVMLFIDAGTPEK